MSCDIGALIILGVVIMLLPVYTAFLLDFKKPQEDKTNDPT